MRLFFNAPSLIFLFGGVAAVVHVLGQTQTGAIDGVVKANDRPMPGVTVTLGGPFVMGTKNGTSEASGEFLFPALRPGEYIVTLTKEGFKGKRYEGVVVKTGQTTTLNVDLELATVVSQITVISALPTVDVTSAAASTNIGPDLLKSAPLANRTWEDTVLLTPGVVDAQLAGYGRMFSSRGGSTVDNQSAFDGVTNTSSLTNTSGAGIVFESIAEVQILNGALPAEVGNVAGAYINIVTKSGGNVYHGEAATYYEGSLLQSNNVDAQLSKTGINPFQINRYNDWSFNLGGPIVRDKLWFDLGAAIKNTSQRVSGFPVDVTNDNRYGFGKLTWQPSDKHSLAAMFNQYDYDISNYAFTSLSLFTPEATRRIESRNEIGKLKWTASLSPKTLLEVDFGINHQYRANLAQSGAGNAYYDLATGRYSGGPFQDSVIYETRSQAKASLSRFQRELGGSHQFKAGVEFENNQIDTHASKDYSPVYVHYLLAGQPLYAAFANSINGLNPSSVSRGLHGFAQDNWRVLKRVTLNLGLRYDTSTGFYPPQSSAGFSYGPNVNLAPIHIDRRIDALDWRSLEPRLGAAIALDGNGASVLRMAFSRYHHGLIQNYFTSGNPNGFETTTNPWTDLNGNLFAEPNEVGPAISVTGGAAERIAPDLRQPHTDELTVSAEKRLFGEFSLAVNAFYRKSKDLVEDLNISAGPASYQQASIPDPGPDGIIGTADDRRVTVFNQIANFSNLLQIGNPATAERKMKGVELVATKRMSGHWQMLGSLVWQESNGTLGTDFFNAIGTSSAFNDPNSLINANGPLPLDRKWQAKVNGTYAGPLGFTFSGYLGFFTGVPLYRTYTAVLAQGAQQIVADPKGSHREADISQLDLRVEKLFSLSDSMKLGLTLDLFNVFNANTVTKSQSLDGTYTLSTASFVPQSVAFGTPQEIQQPRILRIGMQLRF